MTKLYGRRKLCYSMLFRHAPSPNVQSMPRASPSKLVVFILLNSKKVNSVSSTCSQEPAKCPHPENKFKHDLPTSKIIKHPKPSKTIQTSPNISKHLGWTWMRPRFHIAVIRRRGADSCHRGSLPAWPLGRSSAAERPSRESDVNLGCNSPGAELNDQKHQLYINFMRIRAVVGCDQLITK